MNFIEREMQYLGKKRIVKVDENNIPTGEPDVLVNIVKDEGQVFVEGTPLDRDTFAKLNWRDDNSVVFIKQEDDILPDAEIGKVKIVSKSNGEVWIVPSSETGKSAFLINTQKTLIKVNGIGQEEWNADTKLDTTATSADSLKLGGIAADDYALKANVPASSTLYHSKGLAIDGVMTQKSVTDELNALDTKISTEAATRLSSDNQKVSKSGDTITGNLNVTTVNSGTPYTSANLSPATLNTNQTITGEKTFSGVVRITGTLII